MTVGHIIDITEDKGVIAKIDLTKGSRCCAAAADTEIALAYHKINPFVFFHKIEYLRCHFFGERNEVGHFF